MRKREVVGSVNTQSTPGSLRGQVLEGVAWNAGYQVLASVVQFAAMLVTVRLIAPEEYGHWAVALGILQLLNAANVAVFVAHALQLPAGQEPDWTLHWHVGNALQAGLFVICNGVAILLGGRDAYSPVGVLLHIASVGLLFNTPAQMRMVMLQRRLEFRRLRMITTASLVLGTACTIGGAAAGYGARAMVLGGNVLASVPGIVDLLLVERWRPEGRWFVLPEVRRYRESFVFGLSRVGSYLLSASRGVISAALLPPTLGFGAVGLMNRAEGLFGMSAGRALGLVSETLYPVLPQLAGDEERLARAVRAYVLLMGTLALAALGIFVVSGPTLSRVLYGVKWVAADPLLAPGAVIGCAAVLGGVGGQVLLAKGRLRDVVVLEALSRVALVPAFVGVLLLDWDVTVFCWASAIPLSAVAVVSLRRASRVVPPGTIWGALPAPMVAAAGGAVTALLASTATDGLATAMHAGLEVVAFTAAWLLILRGLFPATLLELLGLAPGGTALRKALRLERCQPSGPNAV